MPIPNLELVQLLERLERKQTAGKGIQLSATELDWLVLTGAYEAVVLAAADEVYEAAKHRTLERGADPAVVSRLEARRSSSPFPRPADLIAGSGKQPE